MSLLTYAETRPWARAIKEKVQTREMPPWYIDRNVGVQGFKYDRSLSDAEIATLAAWVDGGAPRGDPADMPPPFEFADRDRWHIGEPDWIVPLPEPFVVAAEAPNWWGDFFADSGLTEDRWIKAVETKPSAEGFPVVHHAVTRLQLTEDDDEGDFLNEYAQGKNGDVFPREQRPPDQGGLDNPLQHALRLGRPRGHRPDQRRPDVLYPKGETPRHELFSRGLGHNYDLDIPPGEDEVRHDGYHRFDENVRLTGFQPHLHNRGKRQCIEAIHPDGIVDTLNCANWDFGWHIVSTTTRTTYSRCCLREPSCTPSRGTTTRAPTAGIPIRANWAGFGRARATT